MEIGPVLLPYKKIAAHILQWCEYQTHRSKGAQKEPAKKPWDKPSQQICRFNQQSVHATVLYFQNEKETLCGGGGAAHLIFFLKKRKTSCSSKSWRRRVSIPVPLACKASALPFELHPRWRQGIRSQFDFANFNYSLLLPQLTISIPLKKDLELIAKIWTFSRPKNKHKKKLKKNLC